MATAAAIADEALARHRVNEEAHNYYLQNLNIKNSSYKFCYKTNPTPADLARGSLWG